VSGMKSQVAEHVVDVFRLFGPVVARRMFGGYGIFHDGLMFALIVDDTLYLKADAGNVADFEREGLAQFQYARQGKTVGLSYYEAPGAVMEDPHEAARWARRSFDAALRVARR
jgi:DNA transformation protein and related proteins